jgi:hypothetical protein
MDEEKSFDLAISLDHIKLIDTFFHVNQPNSANLQSKLAVSMPECQKEVDAENKRIRVHSIVSVQFFLFGGEAPAELTSETAANSVVSFGAAMDISASTSYLGSAVPMGKHSARSGTALEDERDQRLYENLTLEVIKAGYSFASARLLETSGISPFGAIPMPLMDSDELLREIQNK